MREQWHFAELLAQGANIHRDSKKRSTPYSPLDFMPKHHREKIQSSTRDPDPEAIAKALRAVFGNSVKTKRN
jgi:hypothetical protein